ncbi:hypothetical protein [Nonomuraea endophytica]|uniref:Uncharacterized protein n=1 Tax=Nonomuraea endophytica TaxID=714136 RepID=A0A7W8AFV0_9ACTN|nr:hypothetical protein [Nonomuraea endophytica]MBB5084003.1 hypothetical protein [Nonomuraea endophytica]
MNPVLLGVTETSLPPDNCMIIVVGVRYDEMIKVDFRNRRMCYGGLDMLYLMSETEFLHDSHVRLEAWTSEPPPTKGWEEEEHTRIRLTEGRMYVSGMMEFAASPEIPTGAPGHYHVQVYASGRHEARRLAFDPEVEEIPPDVERFLVRVWPE